MYYREKVISGILYCKHSPNGEWIKIGIFIPEEEIKQAAKSDYDRQTKYDNAYDRQKGFIEGVKWAQNRLKNH
jgi:hypothetical protein